MIGKSYIFHLFLFLLILPDSIYSQDNICLIPQVNMVGKKVRYPSNVWKASISRTNKHLKPLCQRSERTGKFVCHGDCLKSFHSCKKGENAGAGNVHAGNYKAGDHHRSRRPDRYDSCFLHSFTIDSGK